MPVLIGLSIVAAILVIAAVAIALVIRQRNMQYWIGSWYFPTEAKPVIAADEPVDIFLAVCDHYEPAGYNASFDVAMEKIARWRTEYPKLYGRFRDDEGRPPQHTFFYPQDEYRPEYIDALKPLCDAGYGNIEIHLHHEADTAAGLEEKLARFRDTLYYRHGLLRRDPASGEIVYGFIHGNWALCNSRPDRQGCGVDQELTVLLKTGCYADFTLPSAPNPAQTRTINSIYYAQDRPGRCKSHDRGIRAQAGRPAPEDHLLMVQGPLLPDWSNRKRGVVPRIENGDITLNRPATMRRFELWRRANVHVAGQPNWQFIKLHTHGGKDGNIDEWLGLRLAAFHEDLTAYRRQRPNVRLHYVTAWEMAQRVHQAEAGARQTLQPVENGASVLI
jgi:hypothetical protein